MHQHCLSFSVTSLGQICWFHFKDIEWKIASLFICGEMVPYPWFVSIKLPSGYIILLTWFRFVPNIWLYCSSNCRRRNDNWQLPTQRDKTMLDINYRSFSGGFDLELFHQHRPRCRPPHHRHPFRQLARTPTIPPARYRPPKWCHFGDWLGFKLSWAFPCQIYLIRPRQK